MSDFDEWNILKKKVNQKELFPPVKEGEIWWCHLGQNIGIESCGRSSIFARPVLIIKKHNPNHCLIIPATKNFKKGSFYYQIKIKCRTASLLLSQIKTIDTKRLYDLISEISNEELVLIKKAVYEINFQ